MFNRQMDYLTADKLVFNSYEAIRKVPGIIEYDGKLTLAGAGAVHLILNGHLSSMGNEQIVALLKNTLASRLEPVEEESRCCYFLFWILICYMRFFTLI